MAEPDIQCVVTQLHEHDAIGNVLRDQGRNSIALLRFKQTGDEERKRNEPGSTSETIGSNIDSFVFPLLLTLSLSLTVIRAGVMR